MVQTKINISNLIKKTIIYCLPLSLLSSVIFLVYYQNYIDNEIKLIKVEEGYHINTLEQTIENDLENAISDIAVLVWHDDLQDIIGNKYIKSSMQENLIPLENEFIKFLDVKKLYDQGITPSYFLAGDISRVITPNFEHLKEVLVCI
mgnify:CR=1 FL=1